MNKDKDFLVVVYQQYWEHARHQEIQRLWFCSVYSIIVAGAFAYFGQTEVMPVTILVFLLFLSFIGYLMANVNIFPFVVFSRLAEEIAINEFNLHSNYQRFSKYNTSYKVGKNFELGFINIPISAGTLFVVYYASLFSFFLYLLCTLFLGMWLSILLSVAVLYLLYKYHKSWLKKAIDNIQNQFEQRVQLQDN